MQPLTRKCACAVKHYCHSAYTHSSPHLNGRICGVVVVEEGRGRHVVAVHATTKHLACTGMRGNSAMEELDSQLINEASLGGVNYQG